MPLISRHIEGPNYPMPELPEVETMRRGILPIVGSTIGDIEFVRSRFKRILITPAKGAFRRRAIGQTILEVGRVGKRILLHMGNHNTIVIEPRMTGLVLLAEPPDQEHLRVGFQLEGGPAEMLWFWDRRGLGRVRLWSGRQLEIQLGPAKLGPDALDITAPQLQERLGRSRRAVKVALLDQKVLAGVGNLYASELLHVARVHPAKRCDRITRKQWSTIQRAIQCVLQEAIDHEGSTLSDGTYRNALNAAGGYQHHHRVYDRAGERCPRCRTRPIQRIVQAQRSTFFCANCQKRR